MTLLDRFWSLFYNLPKQSLTLEAAGALAISKATELWQSDIYDPPQAKNLKRGERSISRVAWDDKCRDHITEMIHGGLSWTWEPPYAGDGDFEWCGALAALCWSSIKPELRKTYFASTYRLDRYARYASVNGEKNKGSGRLLAEFDENSRLLQWAPRAGDILLIGPPGSGYGKHICLVESFDVSERKFRTIEGNGTGIGPDGKQRQGVVRGVRALGGTGWHARRLIRPSSEDLA